MNYHFSLFFFFVSLQFCFSTKTNFTTLRFSIFFFFSQRRGKKNKYEKIFLPKRKKFSKLNRKEETIYVFCGSIKCNINADYAFYSQVGQYFLSLTRNNFLSSVPLAVLNFNRINGWKLVCKVDVGFHVTFFFSIECDEPG